MTKDKNLTLKIGEWHVFPRQNRIEKMGQSKSIEPQCMALLLYLAEQQGKVISRNELLGKVWRGTFVSENTLTKTVAMLRQALEDDSKRPTYIATRLKKGYQLVATVSDGIPCEITTSDKDQSKYNFSKRRWLSILFTATIVVIGMWLLPPNKNSANVYNKFIPITSSSAIEVNPKFSQSGKHLIYSKQSVSASHFDIVWYDLVSKTHQKITDFPGDELAAVWSPDDSQLAYFYKTSNQCGLYVNRFADMQLGKSGLGKKVADCGQNNEGTIDWLNQHTLLFTDRNVNTMGEHKLYSIDLRSQYRREFVNMYPLSFALSKDKQQIATLVRSANPFELELTVLSVKSNEIDSWGTGFSPHSQIAWFNDNERILLTDVYQGKLISIDKHSEKELLHQSNNIFSHPAFNLKDDRVALEQASLISNTYQISNPFSEILRQTDDAHGLAVISESIPLNESNYFDYMHAYSNQEGISAFMSNRNGEHKLWLSNTDSERALDTGKGEIQTFQWSPNGKQLLIMKVNGELLLYSAMSDTTSKIKYPESTSIHYPMWDSDGEHIVFTRMTISGPENWSLNLSDESISVLSSTNAISSAFSPDGNFAYSLRTTPGIWQIDRTNGRETLIVKNVDMSAWGSLVAFNDGIYWQEHSSEGYEIRHFSLSTKQVSSILSVPQTTLLHMRYFHIDSAQKNISFYRMTNYQSDIVFLEH